MGRDRIPFLFIINFDLTDCYIKPLDEIPRNILFSIDKKNGLGIDDILYSFDTVSFKKYKRIFLKVQEEIKKGNTYLLNLTFSSLFESSADLKTIYKKSNAKFKLYFQDKFVCFSPERFIKISDDMIFTYPMKGTIDAAIHNAEQKILSNEKEMAEHVMVVDLLRNDLSIVSKSVRVDRFRYIEKIQAGDRELLQVSSEISGKLGNNWQERVGDIITSLLPAGSISGTPKKKTVKIIQKTECHKRGFFTGVFGVFDGKSLDSGIMIRFIEQVGDKMYYKSGGGITLDSKVQDEYNEMKEKIYVPVF